MSTLSSTSRLLMGNWKMNGSLASNQALVNALLQGLGSTGSHQIVLCAPYVYLAQLQSLLADTPVQWGAQDVSVHESGAYTGEVSAAMLKDMRSEERRVGEGSRER